MAGLSFLLTAVALLGPLVAADKTMTSTHCSYSNSTIDTIYSFSEKELGGGRSLRLSRYAGKVKLIYFLNLPFTNYEFELL